MLRDFKRGGDTRTESLSFVRSDGYVHSSLDYSTRPRHVRMPPVTTRACLSQREGLGRTLQWESVRGLVWSKRTVVRAGGGDGVEGGRRWRRQRRPASLASHEQRSSSEQSGCPCSNTIWLLRPRVARSLSTPFAVAYAIKAGSCASFHLASWRRRGMWVGTSFAILSTCMCAVHICSL